MRTPGCTVAVRASASTFRMRLNFASDSRTPAACGSALPDRPVPAPRATTGTCNAWHSRSTCGDLSVAFRQHDHHGQLAIERQAIALVRARVLFVNKDAMRRQNSRESFQQRTLALRVLPRYRVE